jgi:transcriptional regulatory protein RtcR
MPGLADRREDIAPNLDYELDQYRRRTGDVVTFSREARDAFLAFATADEAAWPANFRDLNAAITRLATLAPGGRVTVEQVRAEIRHLRTAWSQDAPPGGDGLAHRVLGAERAASLDRFDRVQLDDVLGACLGAPSLSAAGRLLFARSREQKRIANDADRLRKYLSRFGLDWELVRRRLGPA